MVYFIKKERKLLKCQTVITTKIIDIILLKSKCVSQFLTAKEKKNKRENNILCSNIILTHAKKMGWKFSKLAFKRSTKFLQLLSAPKNERKYVRKSGTKKCSKIAKNLVIIGAVGWWWLWSLSTEGMPRVNRFLWAIGIQHTSSFSLRVESQVQWTVVPGKEIQVSVAFVKL